MFIPIAKADITDFAHNHDWGEINEKPSTFPPEAHLHLKQQIIDYAHNHEIAEINGASSFP